MVVKPHVRVLFLGAIVVFVFNKFVFRPWILEAGLPTFFDVLVNSLPNLSEAIIGTLLLPGIGFELRARLAGRLGDQSDTAVYLIVILVAGVYVLSQELKFHNLGGNNIYDPWDLLFSIVGLAAMGIVFGRYGFADLRRSSIRR
jgi:hypothetical protein